MEVDICGGQEQVVPAWNISALAGPKPQACSLMQKPRVFHPAVGIHDPAVVQLACQEGGLVCFHQWMVMR